MDNLDTTNKQYESLAASDYQIDSEGRNHYKVWKVQPYRLMFYLNGAQAHIASYLLRTKGEDDLDKAVHWCDMVLEQFDYHSILLKEQITKAIEQTDLWIFSNGVHNTADRDLLGAIASHNFTYAKYLIQRRIEQGLGGIKPCQTTPS